MRQLPLLLLLVSLAACAAPPAGTAPASPADTRARAIDGQALAARHWRLAEATDASGTSVAALFPDAAAPLQLDFADGRLAVSGGCNRMSASYALQGDRLEPGPVAQTKMFCGGGALMAADEAMAARLSAPLTATLDATGRLVLVPAAGGRLVFEGVPTAQARHGGPGEQVFLEVAAQRVPCPQAGGAQRDCLQVRELAYDEDGVRGTPGQWQVLEGEIEGYAHQPGVRNVLRLRRHHRDATSAPGYVLDMVVESEQAGP